MKAKRLFLISALTTIVLASIALLLGFFTLFSFLSKSSTGESDLKAIYITMLVFSLLSSACATAGGIFALRKQSSKAWVAKLFWLPIAVSVINACSLAYAVSQQLSLNYLAYIFALLPSALLAIAAHYYLPELKSVPQVAEETDAPECTVKAMRCFKLRRRAGRLVRKKSRLYRAGLKHRHNVRKKGAKTLRTVTD